METMQLSFFFDLVTKLCTSITHLICANQIDTYPVDLQFTFQEMCQLMNYNSVKIMLEWIRILGKTHLSGPGY